MDKDTIKITIKNLKKIIKSENAKHRYDGDTEHLYNISYLQNCIYTLEDIKNTLRGW